MKESIRNLLVAEKGDAYSIIFMYGGVSLLFFIGTYIYDKEGVYSDQLLLLLLQTLFYGLVINSLITIVFLGSLKKSEMILSNAPILLALYFNTIFQIQPRLKDFHSEKLCYIASMVLAAIFVAVVVLLTNESYFNEKVWSIAIYFSTLNLFDLENNKYFTGLMLIIVLINASYKMILVFQKKISDIALKYFPEIFEVNINNPFSVYATLSIAYWCCIYYLIDRFLKNGFVVFISLSFIIPNIALIIQYHLPRVPVMLFASLFYVVFNFTLIKAQMNAKNVIAEPKLLEKIDKMLLQINDKGLLKTMGVASGVFNRSWAGFKQLAKTTVNLGGGPNNWGPKAMGGAIGIGTTFYFGKQYLKQNDEANQIAKEANVLAEKSIAVQEENNRITQQLLAAQQENNNLLSESNYHAAKGAAAAVEYNKIAREQNDSVSEID